MHNDEKTKIEFSRKFNLDLIKKSGSKIDLEASLQECEELADLFSVPNVVYLKANCELGLMDQREIGDFWLKVKLDAE